MASFEKLFFGFIMFGLMAVALFGFTTQFQEENRVSDKFIDDTLINETNNNLLATLAGFEDTARTEKELFDTEDPKEGVGSLLLFSVVAAGKNFNGMVIGVFNILIKLPATYLGVSSVVFSILSTLLIAAIIFGLWLLYKLGG